MNIDFHHAANAISDVIQNRPPPLREFDQIYMKAGDMVEQACHIATQFRDRDVVFVGDGDGIALCAMHLQQRGVISWGPKSILVLDFDERITNSIERFADQYRFEDGRMSARLYNVVDPLPEELRQSRSAFYTNPPWGANNGGVSVIAFLQRAIECCGDDALGALVVADDPALAWTQENLRNAQTFMLEEGFALAEMASGWHLYHLEDDPELRSCTAVFRRVRPVRSRGLSVPMDTARRENFYGRRKALQVRYVRQKQTLNYGRAHEASYQFELLE